MAHQLVTLQKECKKHTLLDLFNQDPQRFSKFNLEAAGLFLDFSKNHITEEILTALCQHATAQQLPQKINALLTGETVNTTEQRAAWHTALRLPKTAYASLPHSIAESLKETHQKMFKKAQPLQKRQPLYAGGKTITDIINLGIGGSDLGPAMVFDALKSIAPTPINTHFVSNVDGYALWDTLKQCTPETTLVVISSKSFTTQETLANAEQAKQWLCSTLSQEKANQHLFAVTSKPEKAAAFGVDSDHIFPMWDWVGGRYSLWSAIGLPLCLGLGVDCFEALLAGAHAMDQHVQSAPLRENMPVILGLLSVWYLDYWQYESHAILPYEQRLALFPAHIQQVVMESNGKSVHLDGTPVSNHTSPILWGQPGTNGQHAFHQLFFQGTRRLTLDFIVGCECVDPYKAQHDMLFANCLAQSRALMVGKTVQEAERELLSEGKNQADAHALAPHKAISGNQPSNTLIYRTLSAETLGALIALYEHKTFVESVLWEINAFDQYGVELGKVIGNQVLSAIKTGQTEGYDSSTAGLIKRYNTTLKETP